MADPDRKGGSGLSLRTLAIASAASVTAAMVSSRIFPPGTIYASALTPVVVAAVSEMLNRPVDRVAELRRQRRTLVLETRRLEASRVGDPGAPAGTGDSAERAVDDELATNGNGAGPSITIHGRRRLPPQLLHPKLWLVTGVAAFAIAVAVLTLPELIFGGAVATSHRTTFFGGAASHVTTQTTPTTSTPTHTTPTQTVPTQTVPTTTTPTQTTPAQTGTQVAPSGGSAAPTDTGTSTAPTGSTP